MASTGPQHPSMGGFVSGCDPHFNASQQQQAQSQAQIEFFRQQNRLLNQQLATQAQSRIQHLQQTMPVHPPTAHPQPTPFMASSNTQHPPSSTTSHQPPPTSPAAPPATPPPSTSTTTRSFDVELNGKSGDFKWFPCTSPRCCFSLPSHLQSVPVRFYFCTNEQKSLCIPPISHHHRNQCLCVPVCALHPPAIHRCNQCVCVQHPRQQPQFTVCVPPATIRTCAFYFYTSERKSFLQATQSPT